ncbi:MAG: YCF48-related protein [Pseudomonadota bacterium]|nr:YCF48-related protein [Pseudomonadota bacterium]
MAKRLMCGTPGVVCLGLFMAWSAPAALALADIIETPARPTDLAPENLLTDATRVGDRIVAVGARGHIIYSDDEGKTWVQGKVPVSATLTAIDFGSGTHGWAVGHSGVVLHTSDAGATWRLQIEGVRAMELAIESREEQITAMEERIKEAPEAEKEDLEWALEDLYFTLENIQADMGVGPVNPLLDVWFENENRGFVVGAYGMFLRTMDGGETWKDWAPRLDNRQNLHLNGISRITGGALVVVGEAGQIHVSVDGGETFERREAPYEGSLFGVIGTGRINEILAFGLRGNMLFSPDLGKSWRRLPNSAGATLNDGVVAGDGRITLVGNGGAVLMSSNGAETFSGHFRSDREGVMAAVPLSGADLLLVGEGGVKHADARGRNLQ